ncbi:hypothetical protein ACQKNX_08300 [Lysinibacillus sp. NPDC093712]|uniref:hypothetical protein n=1 Tax=Lysinibacillus sp. NPDC093712 TaxID=3390579 RepID=UPI003D00627E
MEAHLDGLTLVQRTLVKAYATSIMGKVRTIDDVKPENLKSYVELEIAERLITTLS